MTQTKTDRVAWEQKVAGAIRTRLVQKGAPRNLAALRDDVKELLGFSSGQGVLYKLLMQIEFEGKEELREKYKHLRTKRYKDNVRQLRKAAREKRAATETAGSTVPPVVPGDAEETPPSNAAPATANNARASRVPTPMLPREEMPEADVLAKIRKAHAAGAARVWVSKGWGVLSRW